MRKRHYTDERGKFEVCRILFFSIIIVLTVKRWSTNFTPLAGLHEFANIPLQAFCDSTNSETYNRSWEDLTLTLWGNFVRHIWRRNLQIERTGEGMVNQSKNAAWWKILKSFMNCLLDQSSFSWTFETFLWNFDRSAVLFGCPPRNTNWNLTIMNSC